LSIVRGALPNCPGPGFANAAALKNRASRCASEATRSASLPDVFGSPVRLGLWRPPKSPRLASDVPLLRTAFKGDPLTSSTTAEAFHPPANAYERLCVSFGPGRRTIGARMIRCGEL